MRAQQVALSLARRRLAGSSLSARRTFFSFLRKSKRQTAEPLATLSQDDLFHPLSQSPFAPLREKAERVKKSSICPVSNERHGEKLRPAFDCPDCGWPTHASRERWQEGRAEHDEYCGRLREVNEDEHDVRSGRRMKEFDDMPGEQPYEAAVSFASWDTFFFTRNFPSIDTDRAIRHVSKVLTYPITVAGILHQNGPFTSGNGRITREGRRSMAAIHSILHLPPGSSAETAPIKPQPPFRIFLLGARAESTLPPHLWQQLTYLFPRNNFNLYFIGPEAGLPIFDKNSHHRREGYEFSEQGWGVPSYTASITPQLNLTSIRASYEDVHSQFGPFDPYTDVFFAFSPGLGFPDQAPPQRQASVVGSAEADPSTDAPSDQPLVQAQTSWKKPLQQILGTKCALFFTAFSPLDLQRDVSALYGTAPPAVKNGPLEFPGSVRLPSHPIGRIEGVTNEFDLILTPGKNTFSSEKWEIAEWDPRVGVKTNWGVWGIRGRRYEVVEGQE